MITDANLVSLTQSVSDAAVVDFDFSSDDVNHFVITGTTADRISVTFDGSTPNFTGNGFVATGNFGFTIDFTPEVFTGVVKMIKNTTGGISIRCNATKRYDNPRPGMTEGVTA